ncbi:hypothetical protein FNU76_13055 [Chitinimonas arctica]|uniref:Uncharacterized protein n=1 Tax=Chitinimonas arctica TaxID=2594795 RepID=A0A516SGC7_9NEIS|nr:hypothetical protein [Chitinimonas arctica]QDQ27215.1 hypothetical protein FNU76_13055 [Chitinimonas arctica]
MAKAPSFAKEININAYQEAGNMFKHSNGLAIILAFILSACAAQALETVPPNSASPQRKEKIDFGTDEILVRFNDSRKSKDQDPNLVKRPILQAVAARRGLKITFSHVNTYGQYMWKLDKTIPHSDAEILAKEIKASNVLVKSAEPNYHSFSIDTPLLVTPVITPN